MNDGGIVMVKTPVRPATSWIDRLPRRARRLIVMLSLLGLPSMYGWSAFWLATPVSKLFWGPVSFLLIGATAGGSFVLYRFVRDRADMRADLDERQRQLRDRAMVLSYQVLSAGVVASVGALERPGLGLS